VAFGDLDLAQLIGAVASDRLHHVGFAVVLEPDVVDALAAGVYARNDRAHLLRLVEEAPVASASSRLRREHFAVETASKVQLNARQRLKPLSRDGLQAHIWPHYLVAAAEQAPLEVGRVIRCTKHRKLDQLAEVEASWRAEHTAQDWLGWLSLRAADSASKILLQATLIDT